MREHAPKDVASGQAGAAGHPPDAMLALREAIGQSVLPN